MLNKLHTFIELNRAILHRISNHSDPQYEHAKKLLKEIFSLYPDSRKSFNKKLTKDQKTLLIEAALTDVSAQEFNDFYSYLESQETKEIRHIIRKPIQLLGKWGSAGGW